MRGTIIIAESASVHPDGTFSLLRGHIGRVTGPRPPLTIQGVLVVLIEADRAETGSHGFEIRALSEDGQETGSRIAGTFMAPKGGGNTTLVFGMGMQFLKAGLHEFVLKIDQQVSHTASIQAVVTEGEGKGK